MRVYKVRLRKGDKKYTLEYHASTGKLMEYEWEIVAQPVTNTNNGNTDNGYIGENKAKNIALDRVPGAPSCKN